MFWTIVKYFNILRSELFLRTTFLIKFSNIFLRTFNFQFFKQYLKTIFAHLRTIQLSFMAFVTF